MKPYTKVGQLSVYQAAYHLSPANMVDSQTIISTHFFLSKLWTFNPELVLGLGVIINRSHLKWSPQRTYAGQLRNDPCANSLGFSCKFRSQQYSVGARLCLLYEVFMQNWNAFWRGRKFKLHFAVKMPQETPNAKCA